MCFSLQHADLSTNTEINTIHSQITHTDIKERENTFRRHVLNRLQPPLLLLEKYQLALSKHTKLIESLKEIQMQERETSIFLDLYNREIRNNAPHSSSRSYCNNPRPSQPVP